MQICRSVEACRSAVRALKCEKGHVAFVPTMGALHEGHMALIEKAREVGDSVVASLFINPTQFGQASDFETYPRDEERDLAMFEAAGVDAVLIPDVSEIYPEGNETIVETTRLANMLHGIVRPGHFRGVTTVVARLFNIVQPDFAVFGEKDYQQLQVIRRMVRDLHFPVEIIGVPTRRAPDGLALSSRNTRLSSEGRKAATVLSRALDAATERAKSGQSIAQIRSAIETVIAGEPLAELGGLDIVEAQTLEPLGAQFDRPTAIMLSVEIDGVLLIDQRELYP